MTQSKRRPAIWSLCLSGLLVMPVSAIEVTVQNDSLTDGGTAAIQLGFVDNESGAAWLTSPCDGTIVAVQVFWRSQSGTAGLSIQDSITIFEGGSFPVPGAVLETLEAPAMTDGVLNEFRFLDENNTIPLSVPITENDVFVVSFKFFEAPAGNSALPTLVTDINGCQAQRNAVDEITLGWLNLCFFGASGDWVIRAVVDCDGQVPFGACCGADDVCSDGQSIGACGAAGGVYLGDGTECGGFDCFTPACCFDPKGCLDLTVGDCETLGGVTQGLGSSCNNTECFPIGACCNPDGSCTDEVSDTDCAAGNGLFQGDDSSCLVASCPQPVGACCTAVGCVALDEEDCGVVPGSTWGGALTDCADLDMNEVADACEVGGAECPGGTIAECADLDRNGIRDDNCLWWACAAGDCVSTDVPFGDMGGQFGTCPPDLTADGNDRFQALNCFADTSPDGSGEFSCEDQPPAAYNVDAGGQFGSCAPDGVCDGNDAFAALNAFAGTTTCLCPEGGPAPQEAPVDYGHAGLALHGDRQTIRAGETFEVDVVLTTALADLRGYQLHLDVSGGNSGDLELVDVSIREGVTQLDPASALAVRVKTPLPSRVAGDGFTVRQLPVVVNHMALDGAADVRGFEWHAFNIATAQMVAGTDGPGIAMRAGTYLASFTYRATRDASGTFVVHVRHDPRNRTDRTFLFPTAAHGRIVIDSAGATVVRVKTPRNIRTR